MLPSIRKLFGNKSKIKKAKKFVKCISDLTNLSSEIQSKQRELDIKEYDLLMESKKEVYMSLEDFLSLMNSSDITMRDILSSCKHVSELFPSKYTFVEIQAVNEDGHIVLCGDPTNCEKHKNTKGSKLRIASVRMIA